MMQKVKDTLERNGCFCPTICAICAYTCGCGYLVRAKYDTLDCIPRLAAGLPLGSERAATRQFSAALYELKMEQRLAEIEREVRERNGEK